VGRRRRLTWVQALALVGAVSAIVVGMGGALVRVTDPDRFPDLPTGLWWALTTVTTVGYGDHVPRSGAGRLVGAVIMIAGIGCIAFLTAVAASAIVVSDVEEERRIQEGESEILVEVRGLADRLDRLERVLAWAGRGEDPAVDRRAPGVGRPGPMEPRPPATGEERELSAPGIGAGPGP